jgi:dihydrofolate synthase/folylpolyglutamate synthase
VNYQECLDYLFSRLPMFQNVGKTAFKKDLTNTLKLLDHLENPHHVIKLIHVAGTNGKGSVSSMLAAVLTHSGYKTGLYTSPHLLDFTERIRINGICIPEEAVIAFVKKTSSLIEEIQPSFFELTVAMAFDYFKQQQVDIAVIEVGLGGRLDSTNVIQPELSVITSIGWDHMDMLGNTLEAIASEKAGIIKNEIPVVCSRTIDQNALAVIRQKALSENAPFHLSINSPEDLKAALVLKGSYQSQNLNTVYTAIVELQKIGYNISQKNTIEALGLVPQLSGLRGRWEKLQSHPTIICDTGHNAEAIPYLMSQLDLEYPKVQKHIIWGMVTDKDRGKILSLLPKEAQYYTVKPGVIRGHNAELLSEEMHRYQLQSKAYSDFKLALTDAEQNALKDSGVIFIGGSTFLVADALPHF